MGRRVWLGGELNQTVIYALGGGMGHVVRAATIATQIASDDRRCAALVPAGRGELARSLGAEVIEVSPPASPAQLRARLDAIFEDLCPDELIVDCFPAGILGELDPIPKVARRTLLLRLHREAAQPEFVRNAERYHRVLDMEPHLRWCPAALGAIDFGPIIAKSPATDAQVVLVASDEAMEAYFVRLSHRLQAQDIDVAHAADGWFHHRGETRRVTPTPLLGAQVVCGAAGFNLTYEAAFAGVHHLALPRPRRYDDQLCRATQVAELPATPTELEERICALVSGGVERAPAKVRFSSKNMSHA